MATPYLGMIMTAGFTFTPVGWAACNGQLMAIAQNEALYTLLGTTYGGDGITTFALPNLQSRIPIHMGQGPGLSSYVIGQAAGVESVTLTTAQMPSHTHTLLASTSQATTQAPQNSVLAVGFDGEATNPIQTPKIYIPAASSNASVNLAARSITTTGGNLPFSILQPFLTINFTIALEGVFPTQN